MAALDDPAGSTSAARPLPRDLWPMPLLRRAIGSRFRLF
jgi:hypothetical protein